MADDDRTVEADDMTMEDLRRLAADSRASVASDVTVQADDNTMDELRRFAAEAKRPQPSDDALPPPTTFAAPRDATVHVESIDFDELRRVADAARNGDSDSAGALAPAAAPPPVRPAAPELPTVAPPPVIDPIERTTARSSVPNEQPVASAPRAPAIDAEGGWKPPARMVMPTEPERRETHHAGPWKYVAVGLGAVVVALVAVLVVGRLGSGDEEPTDGSIPSVSTPQDVGDDTGDGLDG